MRVIKQAYDDGKITFADAEKFYKIYQNGMDSTRAVYSYICEAHSRQVLDCFYPYNPKTYQVDKSQAYDAQVSTPFLNTTLEYSNRHEICAFILRR